MASIPKSSSCTFEPSSSLDVANLRKKVQEKQKSPSEKEKDQTASTSRNPIKQLREPCQHPESVSQDTLEILERDDDFLIAQKPAKKIATVQTSLLSMIQMKKQNDVAEPKLSDVMEAVKQLSLSIEEMKTWHSKVSDATFSTDSKTKNLAIIRKAENIHQLIAATDMIEWHYNENIECAILRCKACYNMQVNSKPQICSLTPLCVQRFLNPQSCGSFETGLLLKKEQTRLLISGKNQLWYRQKPSVIEHLCFIGSGSKAHKKAIAEHKKQMKVEARQKNIASHIFYAAITDLKLGAASLHFETPLSLLANCGADVGNIGHTRKNFSTILYCLEKVINQRTTQWLSSPLPSTLMPLHFWVTVDKGTPSQVTNQAVLLVA